MSLFDVPSRLDERSATIYLAVGTLAALKAVALRNDSKRFRRELREAALFLGLGLVLRTYHRRRGSGTEEAEPAAEADGVQDGSDVAEDGAEMTADSTDDGESRDEGRTRLERTARRLVPTN